MSYFYGTAPVIRENDRWGEKRQFAQLLSVLGILSHLPLLVFYFRSFPSWNFPWDGSGKLVHLCQSVCGSHLGKANRHFELCLRTGKYFLAGMLRS